MTESSLCSTIAVVQEKAKGLPELRKRLSGQNLVAFSSNLSLVAHSIRTGYLLDVFSPENPVDLFSRLLYDLRGDSTCEHSFASVFHLYEPSSDQSFFVNKALLAQRIKDHGEPGHFSGIQGSPGLLSTFVHLESTIEIIEPPIQIVEILTLLLSMNSTSTNPLSYSLPNNIPVETAVALAAVLLDYPVAYVPSATYQGVLSGIPLDFYECFLAFPDENHEDEKEKRETIHSVMKFSCPAGLVHTQSTESSGLQPQTIIQNLRNMLESRIRDSSSMRITAIRHSTHTLNHVAF